MAPYSVSSNCDTTDCEDLKFQSTVNLEDYQFILLLKQAHSFCGRAWEPDRKDGLLNTVEDYKIILLLKQDQSFGGHAWETER